MGLKVVKSWMERRKMREAGQAIYYALVMDYQKTGQPGHGMEMERTADNARFAQFVRRKFPQLETTILAEKIVISLRAGFEAVISKDLREHLERSGYHGQEAIEKYAEIAAAAKEAGKEVQTANPTPPAARVDSPSVTPNPALDDIPEK